MNVRELIAELEKIEDKELEIQFYQPYHRKMTYEPVQSLTVDEKQQIVKLQGWKS